jgi:hypothetical protein
MNNIKSGYNQLNMSEYTQLNMSELCGRRSALQGIQEDEEMQRTSLMISSYEHQDTDEGALARDSYEHQDKDEGDLTKEEIRIQLSFEIHDLYNTRYSNLQRLLSCWRKCGTLSSPYVVISTLDSDQPIGKTET